MQTSFISETELPGRKINKDTLQIIAHRYYWASDFVSGKELLEVGCGPGFGLGWLSRNATRIIGGDIVEENLLLARKHYGARIEVLRLDAHKLPFKDNSFDVIASLAAIIYMDLPAFLDECHRILKPRGVLIINTPNKDTPSFRPSLLSKKYYSVPELYSLLDKHHFQSKLFGAFNIPQGAARTWHSFLHGEKILVSNLLRLFGLYGLAKQIIGFESLNITLSEELKEEEIRLVEDIQVDLLPCEFPDRGHRIVYAAAQAR